MSKTRNNLPALDYMDKPWVERLMDKAEDLEDKLNQARTERDEARAFVRQLYACWLIPRGTDMNELWAEIEEECSWLTEGEGR